MKVVSVTPPVVMGVAITCLSPLLAMPTHLTTPWSQSLAPPLPLTLASDPLSETNAAILTITCPLPIILWGPAAHACVTVWTVRHGAEDGSSASLQTWFILTFLHPRGCWRGNCSTPQFYSHHFFIFIWTSHSAWPLTFPAWTRMIGWELGGDVCFGFELFWLCLLLNEEGWRLKVGAEPQNISHHSLFFHSCLILLSFSAYCALDTLNPSPVHHHPFPHMCCGRCLPSSVSSVCFVLDRKRPLTVFVSVLTPSVRTSSQLLEREERNRWEHLIMLQVLKNFNIRWRNKNKI